MLNGLVRFLFLRLFFAGGGRGIGRGRQGSERGCSLVQVGRMEGDGQRRDGDFDAAVAGVALLGIGDDRFGIAAAGDEHVEERQRGLVAIKPCDGRGTVRRQVPTRRIVRFGIGLGVRLRIGFLSAGRRCLRFGVGIADHAELEAIELPVESGGDLVQQRLAFRQQRGVAGGKKRRVGQAQDGPAAAFDHVRGRVLADLADQVVEFFDHGNLGLVLLRLDFRLPAHALQAGFLRRELGFLFLDQLLARLKLAFGLLFARLQVLLLRAQGLVLLRQLQNLVAHLVGGFFVVVIFPEVKTGRRGETNRDDSPKDACALRTSDRVPRSRYATRRNLAAKPGIGKCFGGGAARHLPFSRKPGITGR